MRRVLFVFALTMALVRFVAGQVPTENAPKGEVEKEVLAVEEERDRALQEHNVAVLDRIYADDLVFVNTRGQVFTKAQRLASIGSGAVEYFSYKQSDYSFHVYGTTVVMTGRTSSIVKFQGRVNRTPRQFTNVYVKLNGQWRLVAHQATPIAEQ